MRTIWKYQLRIGDKQSFEMPAGAKILSLQVQNKIPCMWVEVDPNRVQFVTRYFDTFGTGHPMPDNYTGKYIGTYQAHSGALVFHVYEAEK